MGFLSAIYGENALNIKSDAVHQSYRKSCGIKSQQLALEKMGIHVSEDQLVQEALDNGWFTYEEGTPVSDLGKLMELHGVSTHRIEDGNIFNLINEFSQGHQVIMAVDSGELWHPGIMEKIEDHLPGNIGVDHALLVCGINTDDPKNVKIILTDPGSGDLLKEYPLHQFVDAAEDSQFYMVATDKPVPHVFDSLGENILHLPAIGDMSYEYFHEHYAFLKDVSNRPVFEEFLLRLSPTSSATLGENDEKHDRGDDPSVGDDDDPFDGDDDDPFSRDDDDPFSNDDDDSFCGDDDDPFDGDDGYEE